MKQLVVLIVPRKPAWQTQRQDPQRVFDLFTRESAEELAAQWRRGQGPTELRAIDYADERK